jgi:hypothetical protein
VGLPGAFQVEMAAATDVDEAGNVVDGRDER